MDLEAVVDLRQALETDRYASPRSVSPVEWSRFERHIGEIFTAFGMDLDTPGTRETPARFLRALHEATSGYDGDGKLLTVFPSETPERSSRGVRGPGSAGGVPPGGRGTGLELLHEASDGPAYELPDALAERYPGRFGFDGPRVVANFVSTLDGVVAIPGLARANRLIADENDDDRFVMGLLRAAADVVLIGSGTQQASPNGLWTPASTYPAAAGDWAELRRRRGRPAAPALAVVTGTGGVDPSHPAFERGALVLTTDAAAQTLSGLLPGASEVVALGDGPLVDVRLAVDDLRERGHELIVLEAGPHVVGSMLGERLVDELFLTVSPLVAGRKEGSEARLGFVAERELLPGVRVEGDLAGVRRSGDHLFLHYRLSAAAATT